MTRAMLLALALALALASSAATAQTLHGLKLPAQLDDPAQRSQDMMDCHQWAETVTGVDPQAPSGREDDLSKITLGDALSRMVVGDRPRRVPTGTMGSDVMTGSEIGGLGGGMSEINEARVAQQADDDRKRDQYNRAYTDCLLARGYATR